MTVFRGSETRAVDETTDHDGAAYLRGLAIRPSLREVEHGLAAVVANSSTATPGRACRAHNLPSQSGSIRFFERLGFVRSC